MPVSRLTSATRRALCAVGGAPSAAGAAADLRFL